MSNKNKTSLLGTFNLSQPVVRVSDPCYKKDNDRLSEAFEGLTGGWQAYVVKDSKTNRCASLIILHESCPDSIHEEVTTKTRKIPCGFETLGYIPVDSGQAGFYDESKYEMDSAVDTSVILCDVDTWDASVWYKANCSITLEDPCAGVLPCGAVSSSGYGDGEYGVFVHYNDDNNGLVDAAILVFM